MRKKFPIKGGIQPIIFFFMCFGKSFVENSEERERYEDKILKRKDIKILSFSWDYFLF